MGTVAQRVFTLDTISHANSAVSRSGACIESRLPVLSPPFSNCRRASALQSNGEPVQKLGTQYTTRTSMGKIFVGGDPGPISLVTGRIAEMRSETRTPETSQSSCRSTSVHTPSCRRITGSLIALSSARRNALLKMIESVASPSKGR